MIPSLVVIPARLNSSRLPRKPLADIGGKPMILRVVELAQKAAIGPVWVAAANEEIRDIVARAGVQVVMTDPTLPSGSDRVCAALRVIDPKRKFDHVINLQGDMPGCEPQALVRLHHAMNESTLPWDAMTPVSLIHDVNDCHTPSVVKVATALKDASSTALALYFSRNPIPWGAGAMWKHLGIYGWRRDSLERFIDCAPSPLEVREKLEQLRALENGMHIACMRFDTHSFSVDTPDDLQRMREKIVEE